MSESPRRGDADLDLLVVGEINPDVVVNDPDPRPAFGQAERIVDSVRLVIGSSSVITAVGAARLGLRVGVVGVVGDDAFGRFMLDAMRAAGLDVAACRVAPGRPTGASVVLGNGRDRAILTALGTIGDLRAEDVPRALARRARHLHVGGLFLQPGLLAGLAALFRDARRSGATTSVDPNWDPSGRWAGGLGAVLGETDLVFPNAAEARALDAAGADDGARTANAGADDPLEAAAVALATGSGSTARPTVIMKLGADGALAATPDGRVARASALPVTPLDTTGAGDSFDAGFLAAWLEGRSLDECLRWGAACGALSTRAVGGTEGQPTRAELDDALARWT